MSSFYIQNRQHTVSGQGLFNIKLDNKCSRFNPKTQPVVDIEALNSGLYALTRLASFLTAGPLSTSSVLNPKNKIFPYSPTPSSSPSTPSTPSTTASTTQPKAAQPTVAQIKQTTAKALAGIAYTGLNTLTTSVTAIHLSQIASVTLAIANLTSLKNQSSLTDAQQNQVFNNCYQPTEEDILTQIKKEKAAEITEGKNTIQTQMQASGASQEAITAAQQQFETTYARNFFDANVATQLKKYRETVGNETLKMMTQMQALLPTIPTMTKDNVESVNGMTLLQAIFKGLTAATTTSPALGGCKDVITTQITLCPLLTSTALSTANLSTIYQCSSAPSQATLEEYLPRANSAQYREGITASYQTAVSNLNNARLDIENAKETLENQLSQFQKAQTCFISLANVVLKIPNIKDYTSEMVTVAMEANAALSNLHQLSSSITSEEKALLKDVIQKLLNLNITDTMHVYDLIAYANAFQEIAEYTLQNAITQTSSVTNYLTDKSLIIKTYYTFFENVGQSMQSKAKAIASQCTQLQSGCYIPNFSGFLQNITVNSVNPGLANSVNQYISEANNSANNHTLTLQQQITALDKQYSQLDPDNASFTEDRNTAISRWLSSESLGSSLIYLILHSQLPKQTALLKPLIAKINFNNLAANSINDLLQITNNFSTTSVYYNFSSYLIESKEGENLFSGDYYEALVMLSQEKEHIARDTERCKRAQALTNALIAKIKALPGASTSQQSEMLNAVSNYAYTLMITFNQLNMLNALLSNLNIQAYKPKGSQNNSTTVYKIEGPKDWIPTLAALEGFIADGFPDLNITGGLSPLFTQIQSDQQNYTTQSQTQQLNLQNQMSNVQQEWTLITTSMQVLNKILSQLVGEVYPG